MIDRSKSKLNPAQQSVVDRALLDSGFSCVLQMPTGSGKTWLAREAARESVGRGLRTVYLSPLRALSDELAARWQAELNGISVGIFTGDYIGTGKSLPVPYSKAQILIMTPERLDSCTRSWRAHWSWIPEVDWVIVDEAHLLGDRHRGARLEGAISRFRRLNPFCRVLALSATLGNRDEIADWLDGVAFESDWRPTPLEWRIVRYRKAADKPQLLANELARTQRVGGQSIVFVQSRRRSEQLAGYLSEQGIKTLHHHAGLAHEQRRMVERSFRERSAHALVSTGTLEMGLNLPARQVVLYDVQRFNGQTFVPLPVSTVWQRAGRAGRPGLDPSGEVVLLVPSWDPSADGYPGGRFENIASQFDHPHALAEQILAEVNSGMACSSTQLHRVFESSLAARQRRELLVDEMIGDMLETGMLAREEREGGVRLKATRLGRVAVRHLLRPATILALRQFLLGEPNFTYFDLLVAAAGTDDCEPVIPVDFEELETLAKHVSLQRTHYFTRRSNESPLRMSVHGKRLLSSLKAAVLLLDWAETGNPELAALKYNCYPFELQRLCESMDRLLMGATAIHKLAQAPDEEGAVCPVKSTPMDSRITVLRQMVLNGINEQAAGLTRIKGIGAKCARKLIDAGITSSATLAQSVPLELARLGGISEKRAEAWIKNAQAMKRDPVPSAAFAEAPFVSTRASRHTPSVDPYRFRRALDLQVSIIDSKSWQVRGGLEPHCVVYESDILHCDCLDYANGNRCKHVIAVRNKMDDAELAETVREFKQAEQVVGLDLYSLWFDRV